MMYTGCLEYVKSKSQNEIIWVSLGNRLYSINCTYTDIVGELTDLWEGEGCCYNFVKFI